MRCGAGLQSNKTRRQFLKKMYDLATPKLLADNDLLVGVNAVNLENVFGDIQADRGNLHVDGSLM